MSDYDQSMRNREYPPNHLASEGSGRMPFIALIVIGLLGLLVLVGGFGGGATTVDHPGGATTIGDTVVPTDPAQVPAQGTAESQ